MTRRRAPHPETAQEALSALLDGEIDGDPSRVLLGQLAEDPQLAAELAELRRQDAALRAAFELPPDDRASPPATRALERLLAASFERRPRPRRWMAQAAAALLVAFGLGAATGWWSGLPGPGAAGNQIAGPASLPPPQAPVQPAVTSRASAAMIDAIGIRVPDLTDLGMTLVALGSRSTGGGQLLEFHYSLAGAQPATVLVGSDRQITVDRLMQIGTGAAGAWQDGPLTLAVAGITDNRLLTAVVDRWSGSTAATADTAPAAEADGPTAVAGPEVPDAGVDGVSPAVVPQPDALPAPVAPVLDDVITPEADPDAVVEPEIPAPS